MLNIYALQNIPEEIAYTTGVCQMEDAPASYPVSKCKIHM